MKITYKKEGIIIDENFISLTEIIEKCNYEKIKDDKLLLLKMEWKGWRGFDEGIIEKVLLPLEKIETIKKFILGKTIYFGEINGKHSCVYNTLDENDIEIIDDTKIIQEFLLSNPSGHYYNYSFLHTFLDYAYDGGYDEFTDEEIEEFASCIKDL